MNVSAKVAKKLLEKLREKKVKQRKEHTGIDGHVHCYHPVIYNLQIFVNLTRFWNCCKLEGEKMAESKVK